MTRTVLIFAVLLLGVVSSSQAARPAYWCDVTADYTVSGSGEVALHVTGAVPTKTDPYLRIDGAQAWTALHNQKGVIDDWTTRTTAELPAGTHTAEILDMPKGGLANGPATVIASCTFQT